MYNALMAARKNFTFRLDPDIVNAFARLAETDHRSLNNMVEVTMIETLRARGAELPESSVAPSE
ncbi:MAG: hypothetical protein ACLQMF_20080 [Rectinemataceae bacterium]